jgi:hypothetical protein
MSWVMWSPPSGMTAECASVPRRKTPTSVVPPPMSMSSVVSSCSASPSTDRPEASACTTRPSTSAPASPAQRRRFESGPCAPATMCTSTSSRTPDMPIGSLMPSLPSTTYSWGITWRMSMFASSGTAWAFSMQRSTSALGDLLPRRMAAMPWLVRALRWLPGHADPGRVTSTPATRWAAWIDWRTDAIVRSRFTTTPLRRPSEGTVPSPMMSRTPSPATSPITVQILVVPMSSPTMMRSSLMVRCSLPRGRPRHAPSLALEGRPLRSKASTLGVTRTALATGSRTLPACTLSPRRRSHSASPAARAIPRPAASPSPAAAAGRRAARAATPGSSVPSIAQARVPSASTGTRSTDGDRDGVGPVSRDARLEHPRVARQVPAG